MSDQKEPIIELSDIDLLSMKEHLSFQIENDEKKLFCEIRKKYLVIQPEEIIRQCWIQYLTRVEGINPKLINVEKQFKVYDKNRRFDLLVYSKEHKPLSLFEFKGFQVKLDTKVFEQISLYNQALKIPNLIISNGIKHYGASIDFTNKSFQFQSELANILQ